MANFFRKIFEGLRLIPKTTSTVSEAGDLDVTSANGKLNYHNGSTASPVVTEAHTATLTNKTIDGDDNTVQDLALSVLKAVPGDANEFLQRDGSGIVVSNKAVPTGAVVGTSDTQTLTNKTIDGDLNTLQDIALASLATGTARSVIARDFPAGVAVDSAFKLDGTAQIIDYQADSSTGAIDDLNTDQIGAIRFDAAVTELRGIANAIDGKEVRVLNRSGGSITVRNLSGSPAATERIDTGTGGDVTLPEGGVMLFRYDGISELWGIVSGAGAAAVTVPDQSYELSNLGLAASVGSNALTVALKTKAGSDPSVGSQVKLGFRDATLTTGTYNQRSVSAALSLVVSNGSTLGTSTTVASYLYVYALDNAGTVELGISLFKFEDGSLVSTTAEGGAGGADSGLIMYSATARTSVPVRLIGRVRIVNTAGAWSSSPTEVSVVPFAANNRPTIQRFTSGSGTYTTPAGVQYIRVRMLGGGGGGGASGTSQSTAATAGGDTTFGSSLLTANGGGAGAFGGAAGVGGSFTVNAPAISIASTRGGYGGGSGWSTNTTATSSLPGGIGGVSMLGGNVGQSYAPGGAPPAALANSGAGGAGAGNGTTVTQNFTGSGGGAGGYVEAIITAPNATYSYAVGAGGNGNLTLANGFNGGAGGSGVIIVEEYYQ